MRFTHLFDGLNLKEQTALAKKAGTSRAYLWQLARQWRGKKPSLGLIARLAAADKRLTVEEMVQEFTLTKRSPTQPHRRVR